MPGCLWMKEGCLWNSAVCNAELVIAVDVVDTY